MLMTTKVRSVDLQARLFRGFADPSRLSVLVALRDGPLTVGEIVDPGTAYARSPDPGQVEFRVGINGSALGDTIYGYLRNEDTYRLQVDFNSPLERRRQRQIKTARLTALTAQYRLLEQQALAERYARRREGLLTELCRVYPDFDTTAIDVLTFVATKAVAGDWCELECDGTNWYYSARVSLFDAFTGA